ncbi:MAG: C39 family peptidase [Methanoregula sp.]|jgi:hypothetical protein
MQRPRLAIIGYLIVVILLVAGLVVLTEYRSNTKTDSPGGSVRYGPDQSLPPPAYYTGIDFDTLKSNDHLTVIPLKSYRQQVSNYTCGPVAAMTVLSYYNLSVPDTDAEEARIAREMNTSENGTTPVAIAGWFKEQGLNATWGTNGTYRMLRDNLDAGIPTMVEWMNWGGHWVVVVGYDTRGTEDYIWDDVIIFADSVDCADDRVDGITDANYGQFDSMWFDAHYFPENMRNRAWVAAVPPGHDLPAGTP